LTELLEVVIPPVKSAISYATALHEIGHILGRHQQSAVTMARERWAWRWAQKNALVWKPAMERNRLASLARYRQRRESLSVCSGCGRRGHIFGTLDRKPMCWRRARKRLAGVPTC
jgi:hypothetical protein